MQLDSESADMSLAYDLNLTSDKKQNEGFHLPFSVTQAFSFVGGRFRVCSDHPDVQDQDQDAVSVTRRLLTRGYPMSINIR